MYTQEQLESMSDFEINKLVAEKEGFELSNYFNDNYSHVKSKKNGMETCLEMVPDYCNSWADMGPIAMDNNIVITPCMGINKGDATRYFEHENPVCSEFSDNKEALRAAAIVYSMME